jgi:hypothetical protein
LTEAPFKLTVPDLNRMLADVGTGELEIKPGVWLPVRYGQTLYIVSLGCWNILPASGPQKWWPPSDSPRSLILAAETQAKAKLLLFHEDADPVKGYGYGPGRATKCYLWAIGYEESVRDAFLDERLPHLRRAIERRWHQDRAIREAKKERVERGRKEAKESERRAEELFRKNSAMSCRVCDELLGLGATERMGDGRRHRQCVPPLPALVPVQIRCRVCKRAFNEYDAGVRMDGGRRHSRCKPAPQPLPTLELPKPREPEAVIAKDARGRNVYRYGRRRRDGVWVCPPGNFVQRRREKLRPVLVTGCAQTPKGIYDPNDEPCEAFSE